MWRAGPALKAAELQWYEEHLISQGVPDTTRCMGRFLLPEGLTLPFALLLRQQALLVPNPGAGLLAGPTM